MRAALAAPPTAFLEAGLVVAWSSGFIGATFAADTQAPFAVLFWRLVLTALVILPLAAPALARMARRDIAWQALIGAFAMAGYMGGVFGATMLGVPAGTVALVTALQPLATAALAGVVLAEVVRPRQWLGLVVGLAGVAVSVAGGLGGAPAAGHLLAFAAMAAIVTGTLIAKARPRPAPLSATLAIQSAVSAVLFAPLAALEGTLAPQPTSDFVRAVGWLVVFSTLGGYGFYWATLTRTSATRVASLIYLTPPVTALWAAAVFGQPITMAAIVGFALAVAGLRLAARPLANPAPRRPAGPA